MKKLLKNKVEFNDSQINYVLNELRKNQEVVENSTFNGKSHFQINENQTYLDVMNHVIGARFFFMKLVLQSNNVLNYSDEDMEVLGNTGNSLVEGASFLENIANLESNVAKSSKLVLDVISNIDFKCSDADTITNNELWTIEGMLVHTFNHIGQVEQQLAQDGVNISTNLITRNYKELV